MQDVDRKCCQTRESSAHIDLLADFLSCVILVRYTFFYMCSKTDTILLQLKVQTLAVLQILVTKLLHMAVLWSPRICHFLAKPKMIHITTKVSSFTNRSVTLLIFSEDLLGGLDICPTIHYCMSKLSF